MTMKRGRMEHDNGEVEAMAMANCLVLLSQVGEKALSGHRVFTCKTCNRQFPSFQALGGHRASHNRPKQQLVATSSDFVSLSSTHHNNNNSMKPKTHACSICGDEFPIGQALGGHMRRHRTTTTTTATNSAAAPAPHRTAPLSTETADKRVILKMDLNLTPFENCVKFGTSVLVGIV